MRFKELILARPIFYRLVSSNVDRAKLRAITRWGDDFSGLKILDLGCGIGNSVRLFRKSDYTGIDINLRYLKIAARRYPGLNFVAGDVNRLQWGGGFDIILINSLLHHLDDREALAILKKSAAALNPQGKVIIQEPLLPGRNEWSCRLIRRLDRGDYFRTWKGWEILLEQAGLVSEDVYFYTLRILGFTGYKMVSLALGTLIPQIPGSDQQGSSFRLPNKQYADPDKEIRPR
jgi:SAM-dependent methyltransferase